MGREQPSSTGLSRRDLLSAFLGVITGITIEATVSRYAESSGLLDYLPSLRDFQMDPERDLVAYLKGKKVRIVRKYGEPDFDPERLSKDIEITKKFLGEQAQLTVKEIDQDKNFPFIVKFDRDQDNNRYQTRYEHVSGGSDEYLDIFDPKFLRDFAKRDRRLTARRLNIRGFMVGLERNIVDGLPNSEDGITVWSPIFIPRYDFPPDSLLVIGHSYDSRTRSQLGGYVGYYNYIYENFGYRINLGVSRSSLNSTRTSGEYTLLLNQQEVFPPTLKSPIFKDSDPQFLETVHNDFDDPLRLVLLSPKTGEVFYNNVNLGKLKIPFKQN